MKEEKIAFMQLYEAADKIQHWHNTGRNDEGMVVSAEQVRKLWQALADTEWLYKKNKQELDDMWDELKDFEFDK